MHRNNNSFSAKSVSLGGILLALVILVLLVAVYSPVNELSLYALSSFFIAVVVIELGSKAGWIFYFTSCLLSVILIPNKIGLIPYILFFGVYGLVKFYIERLKRLALEYLLKLVYFNIYIGSSMLVVKEFLQENVINRIPFPWWSVIIILEVVFLLYDYVYTLFIQYYNQKIKKILKL
jgi:hypothetical protein